jgi:DNA-binding NtrC family response regulator
VPPLRERRDEIAALSRHFVARACSAWNRPPLSFSESALGALSRYAFPGNVRELRNLVEYAVTVAEGQRIELDDLPSHLRGERAGASPADAAGAEDTLSSGGSHKSRLDAFERKLIAEALEQAGGNKTRAAELLKMPLRTLMRKLSSQD